MGAGRTGGQNLGLGEGLLRTDCAEEEALGPGRGFIVSGDTIVRICRVAAVRELLGDALGDKAARMPHALGKRVDGKVQSELAFAAARAAAQTSIGWIGIHN